MKRKSKIRAAFVWLATVVAGLTSSAVAHPVPFTFVDIRLGHSGLELTLVAHIIDVAHDLDVAPPERLLDPALLAGHENEISALIRSRLQITVNGVELTESEWSAPKPLRDRKSIQLQARYPAGQVSGAVKVTARLFPYDPTHKTFLNFYEREALTSQAILDRNLDDFEYFTGTRQGIIAVIRKFVPAGAHHILIGPDHLLFLVGLLLLGGSLRQLLLIVTAFTLAHSITLSLAALSLVTLPSSIVEPAIALSIVYVGVDNLMVRGGRDVRGWVAFAFGFIHGFGFASVLREMGLPSRALGWSLFSFNLGVEIGQLLVVVIVASAMRALQARNEAAGRRLAFAGSVAVAAMGVFWFVQRVFFGGAV